VRSSIIWRLLTWTVPFRFLWWLFCSRYIRKDPFFPECLREWIVQASLGNHEAEEWSRVCDEMLMMNSQKLMKECSKTKRIWKKRLSPLMPNGFLANYIINQKDHQQWETVYWEESPWWHWFVKKMQKELLRLRWNNKRGYISSWSNRFKRECSLKMYCRIPLETKISDRIAGRTLFRLRTSHFSEKSSEMDLLLRQFQWNRVQITCLVFFISKETNRDLTDHVFSRFDFCLWSSPCSLAEGLGVKYHFHECSSFIDQCWIDMSAIHKQDVDECFDWLVLHHLDSGSLRLFAERLKLIRSLVRSLLDLSNFEFSFILFEEHIVFSAPGGD